jgi:hypothetical protein
MANPRSSNKPKPTPAPKAPPPVVYDEPEEDGPMAVEPGTGVADHPPKFQQWVRFAGCRHGKVIFLFALEDGYSRGDELLCDVCNAQRGIHEVVLTQPL